MDYFRECTHRYEQRQKGGGYIVKERKLNYIFHNPNLDKETADYLLKILIEANQSKVDIAIQNAAGKVSENRST